MNFYDVLVDNKQRSNALFTYESDDSLQPGQVVRLPFRNQSYNGVVVKKASAYPKAKSLKSFSDIIIPSELLTACIKLAKLSGLPFSGVAQLLVGSFEDKPHEYKQTNIKPKTPYKLTAHQEKAVKDITKNNDLPTLLLGVTGSGKTRVYVELIKKTLDAGKSCIVLSPEVGLGSQLAKEINEHFPNNTIFSHSNQTKKQRREYWLRCARSKEPLIVIGPRSSLFLPLSNLGLIVLDEIHDDSYKQNNEPRYHALHAASLLAKESGAKLVCGSASPNVSDYYMFKQAGYSIVEMTKKAKKAFPPDVHIIDMSNRPKDKLLSEEAVKSIKQAQVNGNQSLVFFNRRGSSRLVVCDECGFIDTCNKCDYNMTLHRDQNRLVCHSCGLTKEPVSACPDCKAQLRYSVPGIKQLEQEVKSVLPEAEVIRFDSDNKKQDSLASSLTKVKKEKGAVIVGTQLITKGLDLPLLESVIVVRAESALATPDYRADERLFQQIHQLIGRVGRGHIEKTNVVLQTNSPDNQTLICAAKEDWYKFYKKEIEFRQKLDLPPFKYLASVRVRRKTLVGVEKAASNLAKKISSKYPKIKVVGPAPALIEKKPTYFEWTIQLFSSKRSELIKAGSLLSSNEYLDLDPTQMF